MPRHRVDLRKHHRPGQVGGSAPQFAVDEVAEASCRKSERHQWCDEVGNLEPALVASTREHRQRDQHPKKPAVKAHASLPQRQNLERMRKIVEWLVEQDVAEAATENDPKDAEE